MGEPKAKVRVGVLRVEADGTTVSAKGQGDLHPWEWVYALERCKAAFLKDVQAQQGTPLGFRPGPVA